MPILTGLNWDERTAFEVENKGWYEEVRLKMDDGRLIQLSIWDPIRLNQEVEAEFERGKSFIAEKYLIILPTITEAAIRQTVDQLVRTAFFAPIAYL
ncbi:MAG TPA: hypothetical protein VGG59_03740 [Acidobacteriaceae bacterium]